MKQLRFVAAILGVSCCASVASADLLGVEVGFPRATFDNLGSTMYDAGTDIFSVDAEPLAIRFSPEAPPRSVAATDAGERYVLLNIEINHTGTLIGGVPGDDLIMVGAVDEDGDGTIDYTGVLLTAEIEAFGFRDGPMGATWSGGPGELAQDLLGGETEESRTEEDRLTHLFGGTDEYDFRLVVTGGAMAGFYGSQATGVTLTSEMSSFEGDFSVTFGGGAKGFVAPIPEGACCLMSGACFFISEEACLAAGGDYQGDGTSCDNDPCPPPTGACCYGPEGTCAEVTFEMCVELEGLFKGFGTECAPGRCENVNGACCIENECMVLSFYDCRDAGGEYVGAGTDCDLGTCPEEGACCLPDTDCSTGVFECQDKVVQMTMIWDGDQPVRIRAYDGDTGAPLLADIDNIQIGDEVTVGPLAGPNDSIWEIFEAGTDNLIGQSKFHRSCSDDEMDGPEDCGNREGNGKGNDSGFINDWILEGLVDGRGNSFDCGQSGGGGENCMVLTVGECEALGGVFQGSGVSCDDADCNEPTGACCLENGDCSDLTQFCCESIGGLYSGDGTNCVDNPCFDCDGDIVYITVIWDGAQTVDVFAHDGDLMDPLINVFFNVQPGDEVRVGPLVGPNDSIWEIFEAGTSNLIGLSKFHRSCSDDEMDGPEDCGNRQGNGKDNDDGFINDWILEGLIDEAGQILDCSGDNPCMPTGACCIEGNCSDTSEFCCELLGGIYQGDGTDCDSTMCPFFECDGKIVEMTMIWGGAGSINVIAYDGDTGDPIIGEFMNVQPGDEITVGPLNGPNDSIWELFDADTGDLIGESKFHRSCSDNEMNGEEDCGNRQGNGKGNDSGFINDWILEGLVDENGGLLDCTVPLYSDPPNPDLNGDGKIDTADVLRLLAGWGACRDACPEDLNRDGSVDFGDLLDLLGRVR